MVYRHVALLVNGLGDGDTNITGAGSDSHALQEAKQNLESDESSKYDREKKKKLPTEYYIHINMLRRINVFSVNRKVITYIHVSLSAGKVLFLRMRWYARYRTVRGTSSVITTTIYAIRVILAKGIYRLRSVT